MRANARSLATVLRLTVGLALAVPACATGGGAPPPSSPSPLLGRTAPDFAKTTLDGQSLDTANARGEVLVVEFFAQYCKPCQETLPAIEALREKSRGVQFVGVSIDEYESTAREVVATHGLGFPVIHDRGGVRGRFRISSLPATFVIDPEGRVHWVKIGGSGSTGKDLARAIESARGGG